MKSFVGYIANKIVQSLPRSKKVSPDITSVKPTTDVAGSVTRTKSDEYIKRIKELEGAEKKIKSGKEMIKEGQKARKKMIDTKRAFQFKHGKSTHAIKPGDKPEIKYKGNVKEQKATGGRVGLKRGTGLMKKKSNVQKIKETFGPKKKKFPDLTGDGKVTFADILKGRGVINGKKKEKDNLMAGPGLYANIHAKRKRGGKMRKKGAKGAPKASDFKRAKQTARKK